MFRTRPADVIGIRDAIDVVVGHDFACALHRSGEVSCWGATVNGQLGTYATSNVREPVAVVWP
jgi:alpha-tubulin suppressor-like RCC1 family protein